MSLSESLLLKVEQYLDGDLTADLTKRFELEIEDNKELFDYVLLNKEMRKSYNENDWSYIEDINNSKVKEFESEFKREETQATKKVLKNVSETYFKENKTTKNIINSYLITGVAVSLVLLIGYLSIRNNKLTNSEIYTSYYSLEDLPSFASRGDINNDLLIKGELAFYDKDFVNAESYFNKYATAHEKESSANLLLYLGLSQLELNKFEKALATFDELINSNTIDNSKGYWFRALVYFKMDERIKAKNELKKIIQNPNNFNFYIANEILKKME